MINSNTWTDKDQQKDGQTLFNRTLTATVGGPKRADHLKYSNMSSPMSICLLQTTWKYKAK